MPFSTPFRLTPPGSRGISLFKAATAGRQGQAERSSFIIEFAVRQNRMPGLATTRIHQPTGGGCNEHTMILNANPYPLSKHTSFLVAKYLV